MEKHQKVAVSLFLAMGIYASYRDGVSGSLIELAILAAFILPILFYRIIAYFSGFGFPEYFAKDFKSENNAGPYALFFWILFVLACAFIVFQWSLF